MQEGGLVSSGHDVVGPLQKISAVTLQTQSWCAAG